MSCLSFFNVSSGLNFQTLHFRLTVTRSLRYIRQEPGHPHRLWSSDADARWTKCRNASLWLRHIRDSVHVPIIGGRSGAIHTWQRKQRADRSSDTPGTPSTFGAECSAWLICRLRRFDHVTDALVSLHCMLRVVYEIAVLTFKVLHGIVPDCFGPVVRVADLPGRQSLRSAGTICCAWWCYRLICQQLALELSQWPVLASEIVCQQTLHQHCRCRPSANN